MRSALFLIALASSAMAETPKPQPPPALTKPDPVPPVKGQFARLEEKKSATLAGMKLTFVSASHKMGMAGGPPAPGMWGFELAGASGKQAFELRHTDSGFEAEVAFYSTLFVFKHVDYTTFDVTMIGKAPQASTEDECSALIDKAAAKRGFATPKSSSTSIENGVVEKRTPSYRGYCGTLTNRVWFKPPASRDKE